MTIYKRTGVPSELNNATSHNETSAKAPETQGHLQSLKKYLAKFPRNALLAISAITATLPAQATDNVQATNVSYNTTPSKSANLPEYTIEPELQAQIDQLSPAKRAALESLVDDINNAKSSITVDEQGEIMQKELYNYIQLLEELGMTDDMSENISRRMVLNFMQNHPQVTDGLLSTYRENYTKDNPRDRKDFAPRFGIIAIASIVENSTKYGNNYSELAINSQNVSGYLTPKDLKRSDESYTLGGGGEEGAFEEMKNEYENMLNNNISSNLNGIDQNQRTIDQNQRTIDQNQRTIDQNQRTIDQNQRTIDQNQRTIELNKQTIEQSEQAIEEYEENITNNRETRKKIEEMNNALGLD